MASPVQQFGMDENLEKKLHQLHPLFKLPMVQVLLYENLHKASKQNQNRFLFITSAALITIDKKLLAGYQINKVIALKSIKKIELEDNKITFDIEGEKLTIYHNAPVRMASIVNEVYSSLFNTSIKIEFSQGEIQQKFENDDYVFKTDNIFIDRIIAFSVNFLTNQEKFDITQFLAQIFQENREKQNTVTIGSTLFNTPFISIIFESMIYQNQSFSISIENLDFSEFSKQFHPYFSKCTHLKTIRFENITFSGPVTFFASSESVCLTNIIIHNCNFIDLDQLKPFITDLSKYRGMIYSIHLDLCEFNEETLKLFFTTIYKSKCFNYLNEIYIRNINEPKTLETLILQLLNTDTIPFGKIIKTLDICSSGFSANHILSTMTQNKTGLKQLKIRNCRFYEPIKTTQLQSLKGIDTLDLSGCNFTVNSLISLFKSLTNVTEYPKALIMDGIQLEGDNFIDFYSQIISIQLPTIETISWRSNIINDKNSSEFFVFLKNQPKLVDIDLSYCISNKEISTINNLKNFLKEKPIKRFVVKGNDNYYIEGQLLPILTQFINSNDIKCIDVCGQQFGDEGLSILNTLMHKSLMAIAFDGSNGSLDSIMKLLENVSKSNNIKCLLWPENDLKKALEQSPMQVIDKMKLKLEKLENIIRKKCLDVDNINAFCDLITVKRLKNSIGDDDENVKDINYIGNIVQIQNKELIELINETIGNKCDLAENDPIMMKITKMIKQ